MRFRTPLTTAAVGALVLLTATGTSSATSASGESSTQADGSGHTRAGVVGCSYRAEKPFYVTDGGPLYAQMKIKSCTDPKPDKCKLGISLDMKQPNGPYTPVADKSSGWTSCKVNKRLNVKYKCPQRIQKNKYIAVASLTVEYRGRYKTTAVQSSSMKTFC